MVTRRVNILMNTDWLTVLLYMILVFMGWINIYAAVFNEDHYSIIDISQKYGKQLLWIFASIAIIIIIFIIDSKFFSFFSFLIYGAVILILIAVLLFGREVHGARSWFEIGQFRLQPSEFAKFATCLALARYLSTYNFKLHKFRSIITIGAIMFAPAFLILLQNDTGSALVYGSLILVLYREGLSGTILLMGVLVAVLFIVSLVVDPLTVILILIGVALLVYWLTRRNIKEVVAAILIMAIGTGIIYGLSVFLRPGLRLYFLVAGGVVISSVVFLWFAFKNKLKQLYVIYLLLLGSVAFTLSVGYVFNEILEDHQRTRINVLLGIEEDIRGAGYNVHQSKIAIGSGGIAGKGFLQGTQTKFDFVPEQSTDFIFCTIGEEWGFLGTSFVIVMFVVLLIRLLFLAERQRSSFSRIYGYGVVSILFFHVAINIGMTIGLAPVIGIPLPFFSYGGSSLWAFTILLFVFLRLDASRMELLQ